MPRPDLDLTRLLQRLCGDQPGRGARFKRGDGVGYFSSRAGERELKRGWWYRGWKEVSGFGGLLQS